MRASKPPIAVEIPFDGGPRDGDTIRVKNPPDRYLRIAYPEWATYEWQGSSYVYLGDIKINYGEVLVDSEPTLEN